MTGRAIINEADADHAFSDLWRAAEEAAPADCRAVFFDGLREIAPQVGKRYAVDKAQQIGEALGITDGEFQNDLARVFMAKPNGHAAADDLGEWEPAAPIEQAASTKAAEPLEMIEASAWEGRPVPPREWTVRNRIPAGNVTLLMGDGAAGKTTIALQLAVAVKLGTDWLGAPVERSGPVIFFTAEEDDDEIHRRVDAIAKHHAIGYGDLSAIYRHCMPGQDAVLGQPERNGIIRPTPLFERLELSAKDIRPALIIIEAAADVFAGNENDRAQVRQFIGILRRLAISSGASILLLAHPSLSGLASGSGSSGSTGWNNSVRSRLYFASTNKDDDDPDPDVRQLQVMKSNYGPKGETVRLRWQRGVFVPDAIGSAPERIAAEVAIDVAFLRCLAAKTAQGILVVPTKGRGFAPAVFEGMPEAAGYKNRALALAMERLLASGRIQNVNSGSPSRPRNALMQVPAEGANP